MPGEAAPPAGRRIYRNAPIVEAVINIQVRFPEGQFERLLPSGDSAFSGDFPQKQEMRLLRMDFQFGPDGLKTKSPPMDKGPPAGLKFSSAANDRVLQLRQEGFAYSHMAPYTNWEVFSGEARPLWQRFIDVFQPERVTRLAARYINRLRLPPGEIRLQDYMHFYPETPPAFGSIQGLMAQVQLPQPSVGQKALALLTLASEPSADPAFQPMVLDIDVFEMVDLSPTDPVVWHQLEALRDKKNELFEAALTERMKETFV